jgi:hypothetical protein
VSSQWNCFAYKSTSAPLWQRLLPTTIEPPQVEVYTDIYSFDKAQNTGIRCCMMNSTSYPRVGPLKSGQLDATRGANYYELVLLVTTLLAFKLVLLVPIGSNLRGMTVRGEADPTRVRTHFNSRPTISNIFEVSANTRRTVDCWTAPTVRLSASCRHECRASTFT